MNFLIRANGYYFPINSEEEKIVEDFAYTHYFKTTVVGDWYKDMSFVIRVYKPMIYMTLVCLVQAIMKLAEKILKN